MLVRAHYYKGKLSRLWVVGCELWYLDKTTKNLVLMRKVDADMTASPFGPHIISLRKFSTASNLPGVAGRALNRFDPHDAIQVWPLNSHELGVRSKAESTLTALENKDGLPGRIDKMQVISRDLAQPFRISILINKKLRELPIGVSFSWQSQASFISRLFERGHEVSIPHSRRRDNWLKWIVLSSFGYTIMALIVLCLYEVIEVCSWMHWLPSVFHLPWRFPK